MRTLCGTILAALIVSLSGAVNAAPFNVRDFGAKGDGVTKDTATIQLAKHVFGAKVVAQVASDENGEFCKGIGAEKSQILAGLVREVWPAFEARKFAPFVHKVMPIAEATEAHAILERGEIVARWYS